MNKTYKLFWYDKDMNCTNSTVFDAENKKEAIKVAKEFIEQYDMEFPRLYEEIDSWHSKPISLGSDK